MLRYIPSVLNVSKTFIMKRSWKMILWGMEFTLVILYVPCSIIRDLISGRGKQQSQRVDVRTPYVLAGFENRRFWVKEFKLSWKARKGKETDPPLSFHKEQPWQHRGFRPVKDTSECWLPRLREDRLVLSDWILAASYRSKGKWIYSPKAKTHKTFLFFIPSYCFSFSLCKFHKIHSHWTYEQQNSKEWPKMPNNDPACLVWSHKAKMGCILPSGFILFKE